MGAVAVWAWVGAVVLGLVILGFCAYELVWKTRRLGRDVERLQQLSGELKALQSQVALAQTTVGAIQTARGELGAGSGPDTLFPAPRRRSRR